VTTPQIVVGHIPCKAPVVTRRQLRRALWRRPRAASLGFTEAYSRRIFGWLTHRTRWKATYGTSTTDARRGPRDNPVLVRRRHRLVANGAVRACGPVLDAHGRASRLAPERWITWACYWAAGVLIAHVEFHPHAGVQGAREDSPRRRGYAESMTVLEQLVSQLRGRWAGVHVVVTGDLNWTDANTAPYSPAAVFDRLGMHTFNRHFDWIAWDPGLQLVGHVDVVRPEVNGQDHPWLFATFTPAPTRKARS
jgi:hypothetical protein